MSFLLFSHIPQQLNELEIDEKICKVKNLPGTLISRKNDSIAAKTTGDDRRADRKKSVSMYPTSKNNQVH